MAMSARSRSNCRISVRTTLRNASERWDGEEMNREHTCAQWFKSNMLAMQNGSAEAVISYGSASSLEPSQVNGLAVVLGRAYCEEPHVTFVIPDEQTRLRLLPGFFRVAIDASQLRGAGGLCYASWLRASCADSVLKLTGKLADRGVQNSMDISSVRMGKPQALFKDGIALGQGASTLDSGTTLVLVGAGRGTVRGKRALVRNTSGTDTVTRGRRVSALLC